MAAELAIEAMFPPLFKAAERSSAEQQHRFYWSTGGQFALLGAAALATILPTGALGNAGPIATLIFTFIALLIQVSGAAPRAERRWYNARAAAESIKSASWEFAVCGEAFRADDSGVEPRYTERLRSALVGLKHLDIGAADVLQASVTTTMKTLRGSELSERYAAYIKHRVQNQVQWYSEKSNWNKRRSWGYGITAAVVELAALVFGVLRVSGLVEIDLLSVFAAIAAGVIGWIQVKKYANLAEAYAVTSHDIGLVASTLSPTLPEVEWAQAVHDAEAAFSREHTMWQARRQGPISN